MAHHHPHSPCLHAPGGTSPEVGGLPQEKVSTTYDETTGVARDLTSDLDDGYTYIKNTYYWSTGELGERDYGKNGGIARTYTYDDPTGRLTRIKAVTGNDTATKTPLQNDGYTWDAVGNLTDVSDDLASANGGTGQQQCSTYDGLNRLQRAWTTTSHPCSDGITGADDAGPDPYRLAYHYTRSGNIADIASGTRASGTTRTYGYPDTVSDPTLAATHPHAVTNITTSTDDGPTTSSDTYNYNALGQLQQQTVSGKTSNYTWNELNQLTAVTTDAQTTSFIYDADGTRLIRHDPDGSATLYLDGQEIRGPPTNAGPDADPVATRYYQADATTVAYRKPGDPAATWLLSDQQASAQLTIPGWTGQASRQRYTPFGNHRGQDALTTTEHDYLGKSRDPATGLLALDNRYYNPTTARFIDPDPLSDTKDPQTLNPYSYAANNPTSGSDPNGLMYSPDTGYPCDPGDSSCTGGPVGIWGPSGTSDPDRICRINLSCYTSRHVKGEGIYGRSSVSRSYYGQVPLSDPDHKIAWHRLANIAHQALNVLGLIPAIGNIADLGDAGLYGAQGNWRNAAISGLSAIPGIGLAFGGWRLFKRIRTASKAAAATQIGSRTPRVLKVGSVKLPAVPKGAVGVPAETGKGTDYAIPRGTPELSERVARVRVMDPVLKGKYKYPNGYVVYMNSSGQTVNPFTGRTIGNSDPLSHIPLPK